MMKKFMYLSTLVLALGLAACGSEGESTSETQTKEEPEQEVTAETTTTTSAEPEKTEEKKIDTNDKGIFYADALTEELPALTEDQLELGQESYDFIANNNDIMPATTPESIEKVKTQSEAVDIKLLNKNVSPYYSTIATYEGYVVQVEETSYDNGETAAWVNVYDEAGYNHLLYIYKTTGDILEEDYVQFWGIPLGGYSYETLDGGFQNAQLFFGAHIEKK